MYPPQFDYRRAESVDEALDLLAEHGDRDVRVLAGGHGLLPEMKRGRDRPEVLVDVGGIDDLRGIETAESETVVGALATYAELADSGALWRRAPALAEAAAHVGDVQIRNRGTLGGNLAQADPAADPPAAALAADVTIEARGRDGRREIDAADFFRGGGETALTDGELATAIRVPRADDAGGAYAKKTHPASGYAMVGVAAVVAVDGGTVADARVAANGATDPPARLAPVEEALVGEVADTEAIDRAAGRAADGLDADELLSDSHASGEFRARLLTAYARRALESAVDRAESDAPAGPGDGRPPAAGGDRR